MNEWPRLPADEVCELVVDCLHGTAPLSDHDTPYRMVRTTNIKNGRFDFTGARYVDQATYEHWTKRVVPRRGDVLLTREAPVGEVAIIRDDQPLFLGQRIVLYRTNPSVLRPEYLCYVMQAPEVQQRLHASGTGATVAHVNMKDARTLRIPVPSLTTQERIADVLTAYDDLHAANERRMALLEESVHLLYREWFQRLRFSGHEWTPVRDGVPEGWTRGVIGDLATLERTAVVPDRTPNEVFDHYSFPAFDTGELPSRDTGDSIKSMKYTVDVGTVLVPKLNPHIPRVWVPAPMTERRAIASSEYLVLRPKPPVTQSFVAAHCGRREFLSMLAGRADGTSTSHRRVKPDDFMAQPCLVPSNAVLTKFDEAAAPQLALRQTLKLQAHKAREARDYLLPRLLSGQLTA